MNRKKPHPNPPGIPGQVPRKGGLKKAVDKMNESKDKHDPKVSPPGRFRGALEAATRNPVEALRYE